MAGPLALLAGLGLVACGVGHIVFGDPFRSGTLVAFCMFLGMPLTFVGGVMCMAGYMGAVARYQMQEMAPPVADTFNYLSEETQPGMKRVATALGTGLGAGLAAGMQQGAAPATVACPKCGKANEADARFCQQCGAAVGGQACPACRQVNPAAARFCVHCGQAMA
jgi:hypothetical protein